MNFKLGTECLAKDEKKCAIQNGFATTVDQNNAAKRHIV